MINEDEWWRRGWPSVCRDSAGYTHVLRPIAHVVWGILRLQGCFSGVPNRLSKSITNLHLWTKIHGSSFWHSSCEIPHHRLRIRLLFIFVLRNRSSSSSKPTHLHFCVTKSTHLRFQNRLIFIFVLRNDSSSCLKPTHLHFHFQNRLVFVFENDSSSFSCREMTHLHIWNRLIFTFCTFFHSSSLGPFCTP